MHPLAGQGLNLGISEATALVAALKDAASIGADPGSQCILRDFGRRRYIEGTATVLAMDTIKRSFGVNFGASAHDIWAPLRTVGMSVLNSVEPIKSLILHVATGAWRS
jgi:2-polyprenyl-6-methoxyphenol hydroxylase-like FAD-dependent oxidoreductase